MDRDAQLLAGYGAARVAAGVALVVAPGVATRTWLGRTAADSPVRSLARLLGVRDVLLGGATAWAASAGWGVTGWAVTGAVADGADLVVTVANRSRLPRSAQAVAGLAAAGAATGLSIAWRAAGRSAAGREGGTV
ncbi:MAG TPA: hypothetical protein VFZ79_08775 [Acidimicrobiales bacterium]